MKGDKKLGESIGPGAEQTSFGFQHRWNWSVTPRLTRVPLDAFCGLYAILEQLRCRSRGPNYKLHYQLCDVQKKEVHPEVKSLLGSIQPDCCRVNTIHIRPFRTVSSHSSGKQ